MHEVGLCEDVLDAILRRANGRRVSGARVRVGAQHHVSADLFDRAFPLVAAGTEAADAHIDLVLVAGDELVLESVTVAPVG